MKNLITIGLVAMALAVSAQPQKAPKMAKVFAPGYYVTTRNDTVRAQIWINPDDETEFYKGFSFITSRSKKPRPMNAQKAKAYGFDNRNFIIVDYQGQKLFVERLVTGRLRFYEYKYEGKSNGYPAIEAAYFIKDTQAEGENAELGTIKKISNNTKYKY